MRPLTGAEIRASFVNCSKGASRRLPLPRDLDGTRWDRLDFLGWQDPGAPGAAYVVAERDDGPCGLVLRVGTGGRSGQNMCALCATVHARSDVSLMVAARAGASGRQGNTVGTYLCSDLDCSRYARKLKRPALAQPEETLSDAQRIDRLRGGLDTFVRRVLRAPSDTPVR